MANENDKKQLIEILASVRPDVDFEKEDALIDDEILSSFDIIAMVSEINVQYGIEIQPEDPSKESRIIWIDDGRINLADNQDTAVDPSDVTGDKSGGVFPSDFYPDSSALL